MAKSLSQLIKERDHAVERFDTRSTPENKKKVQDAQAAVKAATQAKKKQDSTDKKVKATQKKGK